VGVKTGTTSPSTQLREVLERHPLAFLLGVAALLRLPVLGHVPLSIDEAITADIVRTAQETGDFRQALSRNLEAPIFPLISLQLAPILGVSAWALRLPSALAGIASVLLTYRLILGLFGREIALRAGLLTSVSPFLIFHAKEARPYALLLCTSLLFLVAYFERERRRRPGRDRGDIPRELSRAAGLAVLMDLVVLSHYVGAVFLAFFFLIMAAGHVARRRLAALGFDVLSVLLAALLCGLVVRLFVPDLERLARFGFHLLSGGVSLASTKVRDFGVYSTFATQVLFLGVGVESYMFSPIYFLTFVLLILPAVLNKRRRQPTRMPPWLTYVWLLPVIVSAAADVLLRTRLLYYPRAYIATTPLLLTFWLLSYQELRASRRWRGAYLTIFLLPMFLSGMLIGLGSSWHPEYAGRDRIVGLVRRIEAVERPGDAIFVHHWVLAAYFRVFYRGSNRIAGLDTSRRPGALGDAMENVPADDRVILVSNHLATITDDPGAEVLQQLERTRPLLARFPCGDVSALVCEWVSLYGPRRASGLAHTTTHGRTQENEDQDQLREAPDGGGGQGGETSSHRDRGVAVPDRPVAELGVAVEAPAPH
jgi:4-amino-4-deoxy-L-arabinose transferase-like glycosyltransferase